jgi:hypothetical protein
MEFRNLTHSEMFGQEMSNLSEGKRGFDKCPIPYFACIESNLLA